MILLIQGLQQQGSARDRSDYFSASRPAVPGYLQLNQYAKQSAQALIRKLTVLRLDN